MERFRKPPFVALGNPGSPGGETRERPLILCGLKTICASQAETCDMDKLGLFHVDPFDGGGREFNPITTHLLIEQVAYHLFRKVRCAKCSGSYHFH